MKKILSMSVAAIALAMAAFTASEINGSTSTKDDLLSQNVEALSFDLEEWWFRNDYDCVAVTCRCIIWNYQSDVGERVADGTGSVPHDWCCDGCGGCGYTMN